MGWEPLNVLMMLIEAGLYGATKTDTPADDALFGRMKTEFTPTVKPADMTPVPEPTEEDTGAPQTAEELDARLNGTGAQG